MSPSSEGVDVPFFDAAERRLLETRTLHLLHERPRTTNELADPLGDAHVRPELRPYVERLKVSASSGTANRLGGSFTLVYYLDGDTRRGTRKFIKENESELATVLQERNNVVGQSLGEYEYRVLERNGFYVLDHDSVLVAWL